MKNNDYKKVGNAVWNYNNYTERPDMNDYADDIVYNEVSNGKKRSKQKKHKKANHKHEYTEVLLRQGYTFPLTGKKSYNMMLGEKCVVCAQLRVKKWFLTERCEDGYYKELTYAETLKKYKGLEIIDIE
jgi:hypothetical protein